MRYKMIIDGSKFSTIEEFFDESVRLLTKNLSWEPGRGMDSFHDLLRGGFGVHEVGESIDFYWIHANKSRKDLGYEETALHWEKISQKCHPTNYGMMTQKIKAAQNHEGETLFDMITSIILDKDDWYDHTLCLDNED